nr:hypothetical protein K-LCC10_0234 [Kaumoebavirus]
MNIIPGYNQAKNHITKIIEAIEPLQHLIPAESRFDLQYFNNANDGFRNAKFTSESVAEMYAALIKFSVYFEHFSSFLPNDSTRIQKLFNYAKEFFETSLMKGDVLNLSARTSQHYRAKLNLRQLGDLKDDNKNNLVYHIGKYLEGLEVQLNKEILTFVADKRGQGLA